MADLQFLGGTVHNGMTVRIMVNNVPYFGTTGIRYKWYSREVQNMYVLGDQEPYAQVEGNHVYEPVTVTMLMDSARILLAAIAVGPNLRKPVDIDVMWAATQKNPARHDVLEGCRWTDSSEISAVAGTTDAVTLDLVFLPKKIRVGTPAGKLDFRTGVSIPTP